MNKAKLKSYAPQARVDFIAAVTARANLLGLSEKSGQLEVAPAQTQGDVTVIAGQPWPAKVASQREKLISRMKRDGFNQTCEAIAYTWFNRFAAIRYMELHDYLGHGHRALSSVSGGLPDILNYAADLATGGDSGLPGLKLDVVTEMKLAGNRDGDLYRMLLVAQCNALSRAMPFLFERIDDDSELLLPDNLLRSDSVIAKLVSEIPEEDWSEVEIIGWLYQFYISERKDQVIGKVVKSEDIPAATQLFTPNWIVQYLVQNSVGRLWLMANPQSNLASEWPYYITPAEQTPEVQSQLDALIQTRVREDGDTLNPESITVLDPACGSGHILVVAYDVLKAIYLERGYQPRTIPRLILEKNLYGLDIDDRAAQMAGFALLMKARADDRRLFTATDDAGNLQPPKLNVLSLQESKGLNVDELATHLAPFNLQRANITALVDTFEHAKTFGSLIQIPYGLKTHLELLPQVLALVKQSGDMYAKAAADDLLPLVQQAQMLATQFDAVVANPPYIGSKYHTPALKEFLRRNFTGFEGDLFSAFMKRNEALGSPSAFLSFMTPNVWMYIPSHERCRDYLLTTKSLNSLVELPLGGFKGATVQICTFTFANFSMHNSIANFVRLVGIKGGDEEMAAACNMAISGKTSSIYFQCQPQDFKKIPNSPIAYWAPQTVVNTFAAGNFLGDVAKPRTGLNTTDNATFLRFWSEVDFEKINFYSRSLDDSGISEKKWYPFQKGGDFRKWYGNHEYVVNWRGNGADIKHAVMNNPRDNTTTHWSRRIFNTEFFFKEGVTWSTISSADFSARYLPAGFIISNAAGGVFADKLSSTQLIALTNSPVPNYIFSFLNPTLNFSSGLVAQLPVVPLEIEEEVVNAALHIAKNDWDAFEISWDFSKSPLLVGRGSIADAFSNYKAESTSSTLALKNLEEKNNLTLIKSYGLINDLAWEVKPERITLKRNEASRYGEKTPPSDRDCRFRQDTTVELVSYAIGCMMGRYSLDESGLIYAHAGNVGFEPGRYVMFPADADGIVPITDELWFADDAPSRIREFLRAIWGPDTLEENMAWLAESLGIKASETPDETIRRYIADKFFKDHLQTYKKRPIYWLFSSGKQGAFQALVYLHRYSEGTLARMRAEYVVPLTSKIQSRIEMLQKDASSASSTAARNKLAKEVEKLQKKHVELLAYDEQLRHYADMRIALDLDDGVKVNYGKFGNLLAEVKAVTGGAGDD